MVAPGGARRPPGGPAPALRPRASSSSSSSPSPLRSATLVAAVAIAVGALLLPLPVPDDPLMSPKGYAPQGVPALVAEYDQLRAAGATTRLLRAALARHIVPLALGMPPPPPPPMPLALDPAASTAGAAGPSPPPPPAASGPRGSGPTAASSSLEAAVDAFARAAAGELDRPRALARCPLWDSSLPRVLKAPLRRSVAEAGASYRGQQDNGRRATLSSRDLARREAEEEEAAAAAGAGNGSGNGSKTAPRPPPTFVLASNQYNSEAIMPNFIAQVLHLALGNEAVLSPPPPEQPQQQQRPPSSPRGHPLLSSPGQLRVSVYESGSRDSTPQWLELLELLLEAAGVPARVVAGGALRRGGGGGAGGAAAAKSSNDRIAFLARVRNAALAPLARPSFEGDGADGAEKTEAAAIARRVGGYSPLRRRRRLQATAAAAGLAAAGGGGGGGGRGAEGLPEVGGRREAEEVRRRRRRRGGGGDEEEEAASADYADADDEKAAAAAAAASSPPSSSKGGRRHRPRKGDNGHGDDDDDARDRPPLAPTTPWADGGSSGAGGGGGPPATATAPSDGTTPTPAPPTPTTDGWRPEYLAFANDVFFCAQDLVRLSLHRADAACGLDVWRVWGNAPWAKEVFSPPLEFYDFWVSRDADGRRFEAAPPHAPSRASADAQRKGLPFRAQCCWNGLVVLDAAPFLGGGGGSGGGGGALRFRARVLAPDFEGSPLAALAAERGEDEDDDKGEKRAEKEAKRRREEEEEEKEEEEEQQQQQQASPSSSSSSSSPSPSPPSPPPSQKKPQLSARERRRLERERTKRRKEAQRAASLPSAGECDASECSLLCDDLARLQRGDVVVDPGVRVSYFWAVSRELSAGGGEMWRPTRWADVAATMAARREEEGGGEEERAGAAAAVARAWRRWRNGGLPHWRDMGPPGGPDRTECCPKVGPHVVPFNNCRMEPLAAEALLPAAGVGGAAALAAADRGGNDNDNSNNNNAAAAGIPAPAPLAFVNYTAAALDRWWKVSPGPTGGPPVRDAGLGLVEAAREEAAAEKAAERPEEEEGKQG